MTDTCRQFDALIARAGLLTADEAAELEAHLAGCGSCRELARAMRPVGDDMAFAATTAPESVIDAANARDDHLPDVVADRYRITGEVGRGGIGRVLQARDRVLDRPVALKELFSTDDATRRRFVREALITARLQHPSIVPVYDAGQHGERSPFYAMKLVAGRPLDKTIAEATTLQQRLAVLPAVLAVADAMAYAHSERIIHRDLKPANIIIGKFGETIVIDWGLAKDLAVDDRDALDAGPYRGQGVDQTVAGALLGTPAYMAPEQAAGEPVDERADVYALGAILYHAISGAIPHEGTTLDEMVDHVIQGEVRPLTEREPDVPRDLAAIVNKAMALEPSGRYANAQGLADDLRRFLTGQLVASHSYGTRELLRRWLKRHRGAVTVALAALGVVGIVAILSVVRIVRARQQADEAAAVAIEQRSIAEQEKNSAHDMLADLLMEQGRQELLAGRPGRAAVYLSEAQAQSHDPGVALRSLLADAMHSIEARLSLEGHTGEISEAAVSPDGTLIATASIDRTAKVWDSATGTVVATLVGHRGIVTSVSFSPDSSRVVTTSEDRTAKLWDARTGTVVATFDDAEPMWSAAFSPDGTHVVIAGSGAATLWDAQTGKLLASLKGHRDDLYTAVFSADGARVVTASADHTAKVWDVQTARLLVSLEGHRDEVASAAFSPDGSQIVTASRDHTARLWDARTGALVASIQHANIVYSAEYSPDGTRVVTASEDRTAKLWDARTGKLLTSFDGHTADVRSAAFSPDGSRIVTASFDHTAKLWDVRTGRLLASFEGHRDNLGSARFSPDGTWILTESADGTAKLWDAQPSKLRMSLDGGTDRATSGAFSPDGATIVTTGEDRHSAKLWDARSGKLLASLDGHRGDVVSAGFDSAGMRVVTASVDHTAKLWDVKTGALLFSLDHRDAVRTVAFSKDGTRVVTTIRDAGKHSHRNDDDSVQIWNANDGTLIARLDGHSVSSAAFSVDGTRVVTADPAGTAGIWRADNGSLVAQLGGANAVFVAAFSNDGERIVTGSLDHTAKLWDARTGKLVLSLDGHTEPVLFAAFSPDDARVVTAGADHTAKLWDARTGKLLASFDDHTNDVLDAAFSPDGARVVTASIDHTAKVWDARTGKLLASLDGHTDVVRHAAFSPDGTRVLTTSHDGTVKIWDVHLEARSPNAIHRIISLRAPWTLSNGRLVPVQAALGTRSEAPWRRL